MSTRNIVLSLASLSLLASCDHRVFDELEEDAWVHAGKEPSDSPSAGYGVGLVAAGGNELQYFIASKSPPALFMAKFDESGARSPMVTALIQGVLTTADALPTPTVMASDPANVSGAAGNVAVATIDSGTPNLFMVSGDNGEAKAPIALTGDAIASGIAFGNTDASAETDLVAVAGQNINIVDDYQAGNTAATCDLGGTAGDVMIADVDVSPGDDILVALDGAIEVTSASSLLTAAGNLENCFATTPAAATIAAPDAEASFGAILRKGDFDGNGSVDLVVAAPAENAVYLFHNWSVQSPTAGVKIETPSGALGFGSAIAVGDFGGDGRDDLVIGAPSTDVGANPSAGSVYVYAGEADESFAPPIVLHDATPQDDQVFGQSLAVAQAFGGARLIVGAKNEVFTYFRTPIAGDSDFRE